MSLVRPPLYTDENIDGAFIRALVRLGWDVVRAMDVHVAGTADEVHFKTATEQDRVLVSQDSDMLVLAARRHEEGQSFPGLVFVIPNKFRSAGDMVRAMQAAIADLQERPLRDRVHFL